jgi:hypothetical protein
MGQLLTRELLLAKQKLEIVKVELEDGDFVYVRQMTGHERDSFEHSLLRKWTDEKGKEQQTYESEDFRAKLAVQTICDEDGKLILQPGDYPTLSYNMGIKKLETIINQAQKLNKISEEDKENLIKNSGAGQPGNFNSASAGN